MKRCPLMPLMPLTPLVSKWTSELPHQKKSTRKSAPPRLDARSAALDAPHAMRDPRSKAREQRVEMNAHSGEHQSSRTSGLGSVPSVVAGGPPRGPGAPPKPPPRPPIRELQICSSYRGNACLPTAFCVIEWVTPPWGNAWVCERGRKHSQVGSPSSRGSQGWDAWGA
jgi:hypothetical protein